MDQYVGPRELLLVAHMCEEGGGDCGAENKQLTHMHLHIPQYYHTTAIKLLSLVVCFMHVQGMNVASFPGCVGTRLGLIMIVCSSGLAQS